VRDDNDIIENFMKIFKDVQKTKYGRFFLSLKALDLLAFLLCLLFMLAGILVSLNRFWQYDVFFYDFGIFDQAIWSVSRFQAPIIEHFIVGGKWIWADHFNPSIFLFSPLYWLTSRQEILLIAQAFVVGISGLVLYSIGKHVLKNQFASVAVMTSYLLFVGIQNAIITDFHEATVATLPFLLTYLFFLKKKWLWYFVSLVIFLGFKESNFVAGIAVGVTVFLLDRKLWRHSAATILLSLLWGIIAIKFVIPYFSEGIYQYSVPFTLNPIELGNALINNETKRSTILYSLWSFGFLPLLSPQFYVLLLQDFLVRFYPPFLTLSWGLGFHYSALTAAAMGVSSLFGIKFLQKFITNTRAGYFLSLVLIINALFLYRVVLRGPFGLSYNPAFYAHSKDFKFLDELVDQIPENAGVMTQNNLAPHLTHQKVELLRTKCKDCTLEYYQMRQPDYVVMDVHDGQNPNNFYGVEDMGKILQVLRKDTGYKVIFNKGDQYVFKRK